MPQPRVRDLRWLTWRRTSTPTAWDGPVSWLSPPLLLAGLGLTHPNDLSGASAGWWTSLHIILVPLFPLVSHWVLLDGRPGVIAWNGRVAAFCTRADAQRHASEPSSSSRKLHSRDAIAA